MPVFSVEENDNDDVSRLDTALGLMNPASFLNAVFAV